MDFYFDDLGKFISVCYVLTSLDIRYVPSCRYLGSNEYEFHILCESEDLPF